MTDIFTPRLLTTDWNEEWKAQQAQKPQSNHRDYWNKRSQNFGSKDSPNAYVKSFLKFSCIQPEDRIFDMGCGNGALSIPLGLQGHQVIAADFSSGMLHCLKTSLEKVGITSVKPLLMSWDDDWNAFGITENCIDLAFASRSVATGDLKQALLNLDRVARKRVCITLATDASPRIDARIIDVLGLQKHPRRDFQYALNILINEGKRPEIRYITSKRTDSFDSFENALAKFEEMLEDFHEISDSNKQQTRMRLITWLEDNLEKNPQAGKINEQGGKERTFRLKYPRKNTWAFISWNTK